MAQRSLIEMPDHIGHRLLLFLRLAIERIYFRLPTEKKRIPITAGFGRENSFGRI